MNATTESDLGPVSSKAPFAVFRAMRDFGVRYPFGVSKNIAYQTFQTTQDLSTRGTVDSPVTAVVNGISMGVECLELESYSVLGVVGTQSTNVLQLTDVSFDLKFNDCDDAINVVPTFTNQTDNSKWMIASLTALSTKNADHGASPGNTSPCPSLPQQYEQFVHFATRPETPVAHNKSLPGFPHIAAVLCSTRTWLSRVQVTDDGVSPNVTMLEEEKLPVATDMWPLVVRSIPGKYGGWVQNDGSGYGPMQADAVLRSPSYSATALFNRTEPRFYQNELLYRSMANLTEALGPLVAHYHLRQDNKQASRASKSEEIPRLLVNKGVNIAMAVLFGFITLLSGWMLITTKRTFGAWYRDPATLLGSVVLFHDTTVSLPTADSCREAWTESGHSPVALRTWLRALFTTYTLGLIVALAVMLKQSQQNNGLLRVYDGALSIWWTSLPASFMLLVSLYTTSSDTAVRDLAILSRLSSGSSAIRELDISLLDMLGLRAFYHSIVLGIYSVTLSQILAILCGVLTTLSTMLFNSETFPHITNTSFPQTSWLGYPEKSPGIGVGILDSLLLMQHAPNFTWPDSTLNTRAAKLMPSCTQRPSNELTATLAIENRQGKDQIFRHTIMAKQTCSNGTTLNITLSDKPSSEQYLYVANKVDPVEISPCDSSTEDDYKPQISTAYFWGKADFSTLSFSHISFWECNYTWVEIPTELNLMWQDERLQIDPTKAPIPDTSNAQPIYPQFQIANKLVDISPETILPEDSGGFVGSMYRYLMEPFGPLKLDYFGDPTKDQTVIDELTYAYSISAAQRASANNRLRLDQVSTKEPFQPGTLQEITATITDHKQHRLFQNPGVTICMVIILSLAYLVNIWGLISTALIHFCGKRRWFIDLEQKGVAPNRFNSIEMTQALLHESNIIDLMPTNADKVPPQTIYERLSGVRFQMGWFFRRGAKERQFTVGALQDGDFRFLGPK
ncbi:unnamed protein product [Clonostachys rosea]|uniref:Uncharacterized protein n=1 Tax=Bionectria ochroleuca TaxID=29856 RepID=A0ABY6UIB7_BIOOC|nr:unnamed protein product [Clonostachys rosea]